MDLGSSLTKGEVVCRSSCDIKGEGHSQGDILHELIVVKIKDGNDCSEAGSVHLRPSSPLYLVSTRLRSMRKKKTT